MGIIIILFCIVVIMAFIMLSFQAWQIKTLRIEKTTPPRKLIPEIYFRHIEKNMLHLTKYIIQWIILIIVKYWFISSAKTKKWISKNWPKINNFLKKKAIEVDKKGLSFAKRAILESRIKIKRIKEKVKREHEEKI